ncbi:hypothetical protein HAHE_11080 [Haloferula helveola]|uniref:DUF2330 domain-containing protein n=1 Tax=Haloferula helveola TaxID=490095 RepID=A0ABM7RHW8_9BACT|nr:hypothetical protein HAHE_11080 [Haloferula helveola]
MKKVLVLLFALGVSASADETVAWRVPVDRVVDGGVNNFRVTRLEKPPGESVFFKKGDELWDLSEAIEVWVESIWDPGDFIDDPFAPVEDPFTPSPPKKKIETRGFEGGFVVWNATSEMVIVRGDPLQQSFVEQVVGIEELARNLNLAIDVRSGDQKPKILSITCRSGETATAKAPGMAIEVRPSLSWDMDWGDVAMALDVGDEENSYSINAAVTVKRGERRRFARWTEDGLYHEAGVTFGVVMAWGVPLDEVRLVEGDQGVTPLDRVHKWDLNGYKVGKNLSVRVFAVPPDFLLRIGMPDGELRPLVIPEELRKLIPVGLIDASPALKSNGVKFEMPLAVAGFDPRSAVLVVVNDPVNLDLVEQIAPQDTCGGPKLAELTFELEGWLASLAVRSGEKSTLARYSGGKEEKLLEVAPNIGSNEVVVDANFRVRLPDDSAALNSAVTLFSGRPMRIGGKDGEEMTLTAEVIPVGDHGH